MLHLDRIERQVLAERQVAAIALSVGAQGVEMPTVDEAIAEFDLALVAEPRVIDRDRRLLLTALGVSDAG